MTDMTNDRLVEILMAGLPYPAQIRNLDTRTEERAIRFTWRLREYRLSHNLNVEECEQGMLVGSDIGIVMGELFKRVMIAKIETEAKVPR